MAPPKPPFPSHLTTFNPAPKRRHHTRHAQQHHQQPEEPQIPAARSRSDGSTTLEKRNQATVPIPSSTIDTAAHEGALEEFRAVVGLTSEEGELPNSSRPAMAAVNAVASRQTSTAGIAYSGDLGHNGGRGCVEGGQGMATLLPGSAISPLRDNGEPPNPSSFRLPCAPKVFDQMPVRDSSSKSGYNIHVEAGEIWEKGPERIWREGSSVRATFSSTLPGTSPAAARSGQLSPTNRNVANTQRPGLESATPLVRDALKEDHRRPGLAPDRSGEAGGHSQSCWLTVQADSGAESEHLQRTGILHYGDFEGPKGDLWQANNRDYMIGRDDTEGRPEMAATGGVIEPKIWVDCASAEPDFRQIGAATDSVSIAQHPRDQRGMVEGNGGFNSTEVRGVEKTRAPNASHPNRATQQTISADANDPDFGNFNNGTDFSCVAHSSRVQGGSIDGQEIFNSTRVPGAIATPQHYGGSSNGPSLQ